MTSVTDLLSRKKADIKQPPLPPAGHYRFRINRKHQLRDSNDKAWSFLEVFCQAQAAQEDVDVEEIEEFGRPVETIRVRHSFIFNNAGDDEADASNEDTGWRLQTFLDQLGLEADEEENQQEQLARIENMEFIGQLSLQPDKRNPDIVRPQISRTLGLHEVPDYQ